MEKRKANKKEIKDGDILPMVGGPLDGEERAVNFVFPFLDGGVAPSGISYGNYFYFLNKEKKCWEYQTVKKVVQNEKEHG